jgi:hypothetical protein
MRTASIPCNVRHAVEKDWYPFVSQTRLFETRWSCSTTLFKYLHWRNRPPPSEYAFDLEFLYGRRIRSVLVHVDHPSLRIGWVEQRLTKESLGCCGIAFCREQEVDGLPCGIRGSLQKSVLPLYPDVGFINAIAFVGAFQVSASALVQFRSIDLNPAPYATGVNE